jgi:hypothetical protein
MYELFTKFDDGKLAAGEVEALAGYYKGLRADAKAKVKAPLVAMFNDSKFAAGAKAKFKTALLDAGLNEADLKKAPGTLTDLEKKTIKDDLYRLADNGGDEGVSKEMTLSQVPWELQSAMNDALANFRQRASIQFPGCEFPDAVVKAVSTAGARPKLVGYQLEQRVYKGDHDFGSRLFFSKNGISVGEMYAGN